MGTGDRPWFVWTNAWHGPSRAEGRVIRPAILWNDQRTGKAVDGVDHSPSRLISALEILLLQVSTSKLVWLRTEEPQAYALLRGPSVKDYLGYVLTGEPEDRLMRPVWVFELG